MNTRLIVTLLLLWVSPFSACERSPRLDEGIESTEETIPQLPCPATVSCHEDASCFCDENGNLTREIGSMGQITWRTTNTYDEMNNQITSESHTTGYNTNVPERWTFTYDENGNQLTSNAIGV